MKIGIIGAGKLASALARRLVAARHDVMISNSRGTAAVEGIAAELNCRAGSAADAAKHGIVVVVSVPLKAFAALPAADIGRRTVIDTCNYYPGRDGLRPEFESGGETTSGALQKALPQSKVVKAFNSVLATDLAQGGGAVPGGGRHALPIAGDDPDAVELVAGIVRDAGFDPVVSGSLAQSWRFERARPVYCRPLDPAALRTGLDRTGPSDFVAEGSWRPAALTA
jgi:predicted dinucleotide-binding enzyme